MALFVNKTGSDNLQVWQPAPLRTQMIRFWAEARPSEFLSYMQKRGIRSLRLDDRTRTDIALSFIALRLIPRMLDLDGEFIEDFEIQDQQALVAYSIRNFNISNELDRIRIALACATQGRACGVSTSIKAFAIQNEAARFAIAMACAASDGLVTMRYIGNFEIQDRGKLGEILKCCVIQWALSSVLAPLNIKKEDKSFQNLIDVANKEKPPTDLVFEQFLREFFPHGHLEWVVSYLRDIRDSNVHDEVAASLARMLILCWVHSASRETLDWIQKRHLIEHIYQLHAPRLYLLLVNELLESCVQSQVKRAFDATSPLRLEEYRDYYDLVRLLLAGLSAQGVQVEELVGKLNENKKVFKEGKNLQLLLFTLLRLKKTSLLSPEEKTAILKEIRGDLCRGLLMLSTLFDLNQILLLKDRSKPLEDIYREVLKNLLPMEGIADPVTALEDRFGQQHTASLLEYAAGLKTLGNPALMSCITKFASSVLDGTFLKKRYDFNQSSHLAQVGPQTVDAWEKGCESFQAQPRHEGAWEARKWLVEKLLTDQHMGAENGRAFELCLTSGNFGQSGLQQACRKLIEALTVQEQIIALQEMHPLAAGYEFANDIESKLRELTGGIRTASCTIIDTDDPIHLLRSGTDVQGSCQRIGGDPKYNRGLLGYLMHGQTRLIAAVDAKGRIQARALFRLLWDGEQPVLFLDRYYGARGWDHAFLKMAQTKAKQMGLTWTLDWLSWMSDEESPRSHPKPLQSLGGPAPVEYCDAAGGLCPQGIFTIQKAFIYNS